MPFFLFLFKAQTPACAACKRSPRPRARRLALVARRLQPSWSSKRQQEFGGCPVSRPFTPRSVQSDAPDACTTARSYLLTLSGRKHQKHKPWLLAITAKRSSLSSSFGPSLATSACTSRASQASVRMFFSGPEELGDGPHTPLDGEVFARVWHEAKGGAEVARGLGLVVGWWWAGGGLVVG